MVRSGNAVRWVPLLAIGVVLLASAIGTVYAQAEASPPAAEAPAVEAPAEAPAPEAPPPVPEEPPPEIEALEAAEATVEQSADLTGFRERELRAKLAVAQREERDADLLLPWVTMIAGWGTVLVGTAVGVGVVLGCDEDSCTGPYWPTWLVVGGSLVGSVGTLWLVLEERDLAELKIRRERIERQLEESRYNRPIARAPTRPLTVAWSGRF